MDMLDPLESGESEEVESKLILNEIHIKGQANDSDDDANVEHLSPQTLLETPDHEVQYSIRSPEGNMITYRVLQVDDANVESSPQLVTTASSSGFSNPVPQVIGSNLNGQLYVIGNANEMFATQSGTRAIAPRTAIVETSSNSVVSSIKKRDERRRATHNEVERRRRDKINNWITKLATIIPENASSEIRANGHYDGQSKGGILAKACDYIMDLKDIATKYEVLAREHTELVHTMEIVNSKNVALERENKELKTLLKKNSILYVPSGIS